MALQPDQGTEEREAPAKKRILIADDEKNIVRLVEFHLNRAGHGVEKAYNGKEALDKAKGGGFDLIILDVMMPLVDGLTVLRELRASRGTETTPIIVISARAQDHDVFLGYQAGADVYLPKPFSPVELMKLIERFFTYGDLPT